MALFVYSVIGYSCLALAVLLMSPMIADAYKDYLWFLPSHIYRESTLNMFGCYALFLVIILINPIYTTVGMICGCIHWITHVGRKR